MRKELQKIDGQRMRFTAKVKRFGTKRTMKGFLQTVLLEDVCILETGEQVTEHLWFTKGKSWWRCDVGLTVEFDARVTDYYKGYQGHKYGIYGSKRKKDYKLERPTKVHVKDDEGNILN